MSLRSTVVQNCVAVQHSIGQNGSSSSMERTEDVWVDDICARVGIGVRKNVASSRKSKIRVMVKSLRPTKLVGNRLI